MAKEDNNTQKSDLDEVLNENEIENIDTSVVKASITDEMQKAYLDYAMSVIVSRALPDVRDGLKPVQRRIIYAMQDQNMTSTAKFYKCAAVVGEVMKKYHPHGDTSIYDALVRMGRPWSMRYPFIWPQGNFGSVDGDPPAAMRYTESKLQKISELLYQDIKSDTVDFEMNDLQNEEPVYLPSLLPNVLLNGASGIAVGMATNIPPHNLSEVVDAILDMIENAETIGIDGKKDGKDTNLVKVRPKYSVPTAQIDFSSKSTVEDLVKHINGPDFPTGGIIYDQKELTHMYATGKGRVVTRAKLSVEEPKKKSERVKIVVTEIPFQVHKATIVSKIADAVRNKKIEGVSDLRDESNRDGMRIVIELKRDATVKKVQNQLYKHSQLQSTFNTNMVALLDGEPKLMTLKMILEEFVKHRQQVVVRRAIFFLGKAKDREHILRGLKIALDNLDEVIKLIRNSKDAETARTGLIKSFDLSEIQAQAILDMQLRRLAALERKKIEDELKEIINTIKDFESLLISSQKIIDTVSSELKDLKNTYGDERLTKVVKSKLDQIEDSDLIPNERCIITTSKSGYIKRLKESAYKKQSRGGKGVKGQDLKEEDVVDIVRICNTHDYALFFTSTGKVHKMRIWEIPETSKNSKGTAIVNFLNLSQTDEIGELLILEPEIIEKSNGFIVFGTKNGLIKKTSVSDYENIRSSGITAIKLDSGDELAWVSYSDGKCDIMLITSMGQAIRFSEKDARAMGRVAKGVRGVRLSKKDDKVVGMAVIPNESNNCNLLVVSEGGYGKKTSLDEYRIQNRGGSGLLTYRVKDKTGKLVTGRIICEDIDADILVATKSGKFIRLEKSEIPQLSRDTQGVRLMRLGSSDIVTSVAVLEESAKEEVEDEKKK